ncbi:glycosyltransferase family 4 protein [Desulfotomaculum sp. 1211_IL3151]|uniref:glycosyltransferase family 4 protein n=1 Tax=Desulfotomaculum sp. 1211_IL3151 TaxID=3084055 RepID=UPI002FDA6D9A
MRIAIVGPSPVPFTIGGVENLLWGLTGWLNEHTPHTVELIKLPSRENNFWEIINSYAAFRKLDLSYFDMVLSTKYPAWMVKHDNHICYLQHRLRGLYDTYHFTGLGTEVPRTNKNINALLTHIEHKSISVDHLLDELLGLREKQIPQEFFQFPGPFIKKIITYLDDQAMIDIKRFYCISQTVKNRTEYFPPGVVPQVVHHPSFLMGYQAKSYDYIFTVSRLDGPKRVKLLIKAMQYVKSDIKLKIAGTGPMEQELKQMAAKDPRIEFLGFVNNDRLLEHYAQALVVPFMPYDEDYGLITIEAFMSKKPVLTCLDSGGSNEFVKDNLTGYSVPPDPWAIAEKLDLFANNKEAAIQMGQEGYRKVQNINWEKVAKNLLEVKLTVQRKKKIVVTTTMPIYPPMGGGQSRIYNLYKHLAVDYDVEIVCFTNYDQPAFDQIIAPGVREIRLPKSVKHQEKEWDIERQVGLPVGDVTMPLLSQYTPEYGKTLRRRLQGADFVVISHPYLYDEVAEVTGVKVIHEAHNVEFDLKSKVLAASSKKLIDEVFRVEKLSCEKSELIMTCSQEDKERLAELYQIPLEKFIIVPNGVDLSSVPFTGWEERRKNKRELDLENEFLALFMGSWHPPNLEACENVFQMAKQIPEVKFLLLGSQCLAFAQKEIPPNVGLLGAVTDEEKNYLFSLVDIALNPMVSGSGTNLKMFDYMAAGIPVLSTEFGARGIGAVNGEQILISSLRDMPGEIYKFQNMSPEASSSITARAADLVRERFAWNKIAEKLRERLKNFD